MTPQPPEPAIVSPSQVLVFGIANCDTVRKARAWLRDHGVVHGFHDFKTQGLPADRLDAWLLALGHEQLINRKGTTWRALSPEMKAAVVDTAGARALALAQPSVIKRPVIDWGGGKTTVGFAPEQWNAGGTASTSEPSRT